jgi:small subunit ribosomal protein S1
MYKTRFKFVERAKATASRKPNQKPFLSNNQNLDLYRIKICFDKNKLMNGKIINRIKCGYKVLIANYEVFCPDSHMVPISSDKYFKEKIQFRFFKFKIIHIKGRSVVVSRKEALKIEILGRLRSGQLLNQTVKGVVKAVKPYGAFVDIGGVDGLVHISNLSNEYIENIHDIVNIGDQVMVRILYVNDACNKISLSMETNISSKYKNPKRILR